MDWTILCDFDGTITVEDVTDSLLQRFARPGWERLEEQWRAGIIGSRECMEGQVALIDASRAEIESHLETMRIDRAFPVFVDAVQTAGIQFQIVSDGLDYAIRSILARYHLDLLPINANRLVPNGPRRWRLDFPFADAGCRVASGTCKCACSQRLRKANQRVLLIGDGVSDFCIAERADFVFAKHRLIEHCRAAGIPYAPITGFDDVLTMLPSLLRGTLGAFSPITLPQDTNDDA